MDLLGPLCRSCCLVLVKQHCFGCKVLSCCSQPVCHHKPQNGTCGSAVLGSALIHTIVVSLTAISTEQKCTKAAGFTLLWFFFLVPLKSSCSPLVLVEAS